MKAISLWQPWASAIAIGAKRIETRGWSTSYRGPIAIHAAVTRAGLHVAMPVGDEPRARFWAEVLCVDFRTPRLEAYDYAPNIVHRSSMPFGAIVAVADLVDVVPVDSAELATRLGVRERFLGDYTPGRFAWLMRNVRALPAPIPFRGRQGLFEVPDELLSALANQPTR